MCFEKHTEKKRRAYVMSCNRHFPSPPKGHRCSYLMGQLDVLRVSPPPICAAISISYLKSCEECFVVKVNLVGRKKKSLLWDLCLSRYKGKRTLMIHSIMYLFFPPCTQLPLSGEQGGKDARGRLTSDCLMACKGVKG